MKLTLQKVKNCVIKVDGEIVCSIENGILCFIGFHKDDKDGDADWIARKALSMFYWSAEDDTPWKRGVMDVNGDVVVVSEPGLLATVDFDNKPSFENVMSEADTSVMYNKLVEKMKKSYKPEKVHAIPLDKKKTLEFINDGPLTLSIDSYRRRD